MVKLRSELLEHVKNGEFLLSLFIPMLDRESMHVRMADESVCIGSHQPANSYLNIPALLSAIDLTGAQAVHPGYGFLSENANFAKILEENKIKFIGASSEHIEMMGDKIQAKK